MAIIITCTRCGDTEFTEIGELLQCRSCKLKTPKPKENADKLERARAMRMETMDFDEASRLYEEIIRDTPDEAEAYWGRVLCRYGIEYVQDSNGKYLPTCHRTLDRSVLEDADYLMAISKAEPGMMEQYRSQAQLIEDYQRDIKLIASREKPYDVFISFKATDDYGRPTEDSSIAQDIYFYLTKTMGLKVFFSEITLKGKAGQKYEPIIYAALQSASFMILVGTRPEYINATWVKNEWSRYARMAEEARRQGKAEKYLICALSGMKSDQLPSTLAHYQNVDLSGIGAKEMLYNSIDSIIDARRKKHKDTQSKTNKTSELADDATNLCALGFEHLEMQDFAEADKNFKKATEKKYDCALAYWGRLLAERRVVDDDALARYDAEIIDHKFYKLAMRHATPEERARFDTVANRCHQNYVEETARIEAKRQHNEAYRKEVKNLTGHYEQNFSGNRVAFDEQADKLFDAYFDKIDEKSKLKQKRLEQMGIEPSYRNAILYFVGTGLFLIFSGILALDTMKVEIEGLATFLFIVSCFTVIPIYLYILISKFVRGKIGIGISIIVGEILTISIMTPFQALTEKSSAANYLPLIISLIFLLAGLLWLIKKKNKKHEKEKLYAQETQCKNAITEIKKEIEERSIQQMTELNNRYEKQYGKEISPYESTGIIAARVLQEKN